MVVQYVPLCDRSKNRALDGRRETGTSTFPSVQIYQCHTPVKFSVDGNCLCLLRVVSTELRLHIAEPQTLRKPWQMVISAF